MVLPNEDDKTMAHPGSELLCSGSECSQGTQFCVPGAVALLHPDHTSVRVHQQEFWQDQKHVRRKSSRRLLAREMPALFENLPAGRKAGQAVNAECF